MLPLVQAMAEKRNSLNLTPYDLSRILDCSIASIEKWENDIRDPGAEACLKIERWLNNLPIPREDPDLPEKITERREMLGQTIAELADTLGFSARTLRAWEEGINKPKNENLLKILAWLEDTSTVS